jgi:hypothetical protein
VRTIKELAAEAVKLDSGDDPKVFAERLGVAFVDMLDAGVLREPRHPVAVAWLAAFACHVGADDMLRPPPEGWHAFDAGLARLAANPD